MRYALDNGAWGAHQAGEEFDAKAFELAVHRVGRGADWVVAPDIVCGGRESLKVSMSWLPWLLHRVEMVLVPVQDGMMFSDFEGIVGERVGLFIGGSTEWKENAIIPWGRWAARRGVTCHVGRVNTARRISLVVAGLCSSFDGSSVARYPSTLRALDAARLQLALDV